VPIVGWCVRDTQTLVCERVAKSNREGWKGPEGRGAFPLLNNRGGPVDEDKRYRLDLPTLLDREM